jgi:hypothetical protein
VPAVRNPSHHRTAPRSGRDADRVLDRNRQQRARRSLAMLPSATAAGRPRLSREPGLLAVARLGRTSVWRLIVIAKLLDDPRDRGTLGVTEHNPRNTPEMDSPRPVSTSRIEPTSSGSMTRRTGRLSDGDDHVASPCKGPYTSRRNSSRSPVQRPDAVAGLALSTNRGLRPSPESRAQDGSKMALSGGRGVARRRRARVRP